jgi:isocitrate/isopropylmalate dehydrogenase
VTAEFQIAVFPGDGIGLEVMEACLAVLEVLERKDGGYRLRTETLPAGAALHRDTGTALSEESFRKAEAADSILFSAMGRPDVRYPDGTEIARHLEMRREFGLFAGVRPAKTYPNTGAPLADPRAGAIDLVILRESTEGLFASRGKGTVEDDREARDTMVITRATCERLFDFAFRLAERRKARGGKGRVTCVDKANVFTSMAFFRKVFDERARLPGGRGRPPLRRRHGARPGAPTLGVRRAGHGEHVRRHPLGPRGGPGRRHGHGAVRRARRAPRPCSSPPTARPPTSPAPIGPTRSRCRCRQG